MAFVDVRVEATGNIEQVPAFWLEDPILGKGITLVESEPNPVPVAPVDAASEVEVTGPVETLPSLIPAVRDAIAAREAAVEADATPTEANTKAEIEDFATRAGIDLGDAKTKADQLEVIAAHLDTDDTESSTKTPATGDKE